MMAGTKNTAAQAELSLQAQANFLHLSLFIASRLYASWKATTKAGLHPVSLLAHMPVISKNVPRDTPRNIVY